jgi:8-oxo-dGTP diphosphatase
MFPDRFEPGRRVPCVGALVHDDEGRLLVVRRAQEPGLGQWSVPGGRVEPDEDDRAAVAREVLEETGLHARRHRPATGPGRRDLRHPRLRLLAGGHHDPGGG